MILDIIRLSDSATFGRQNIVFFKTVQVFNFQGLDLNSIGYKNTK